MSDRQIEIEGHIVAVQQAEYSILPYKMYERIKRSTTTDSKVKELLLHLENDASPRNFPEFVNADCICRILERLSLKGLRNVAKTCKRLNEIAQTVFEQKYRNRSITLSGLNNEKMPELRFFINTFGSSITSINLNAEIKDGLRDDVFRLLDQGCINLKSLKLNGEFMKDFIVDNYIGLFGRLKELYITLLGFLQLQPLLAVCPQLERLDVIVNYTSNFENYEKLRGKEMDFTDVTLPSLVALRLKTSQSHLNSAGIIQFTKRHPRIEIFVLELPCVCCANYSYHYAENIAIYKMLPNIREITLYPNGEDHENEPLCLSEMKNLKSVKLDFIYGGSVTPAINALLKRNTKIEELHLLGSLVDNDAIEAVCKIKTIKKIVIENYEITSLQFIRIIQTLPNLKSVIAMYSTSKSCSRFEFLHEILPILRSKCIEWVRVLDADATLYVSSYFFYTFRILVLLN